MPATKRGVYHNLKESKYTISNGEIVFFFSSRFVLSKFLDGYQKYRETFGTRLKRVMDDTPLNMDTLSDITFYKDTEKRGFRVWVKGVDISEEDLYLYALRKMSDTESLEWFVYEKEKLRRNAFKGVH